MQLTIQAKQKIYNFKMKWKEEFYKGINNNNNKRKALNLQHHRVIIQWLLYQEV